MRIYKIIKSTFIGVLLLICSHAYADQYWFDTRGDDISNQNSTNVKIDGELTINNDAVIATDSSGVNDEAVFSNDNGAELRMSSSGLIYVTSNSNNVLSIDTNNSQIVTDPLVGDVRTSKGVAIGKDNPNASFHFNHEALMHLRTGNTLSGNGAIVDSDRDIASFPLRIRVQTEPFKQGDYFVISDYENATTAIWFDIGDNGTEPAGATYSSADTKIEIDINITNTEDEIALLVEAAIDGIPNMQADVIPCDDIGRATVQVTMDANGQCNDVVCYRSTGTMGGISVKSIVDQDGIDGTGGQPEIQTIILPSNKDEFVDVDDTKFVINGNGKVSLGYLRLTPMDDTVSLNINTGNRNAGRGIVIDSDAESVTYHDTAFRIRTKDNGDDTFSNDTDTKFIVTGNGNVGINTKDPQTKLDVNGDIAFSGSIGNIDEESEMGIVGKINLPGGNNVKVMGDFCIGRDCL